jgi:antirestriction protein ArdC
VPPPESEAPVPPDRRFEVAGLLLDVMPDVPEIVHSASKEPAYEGFRDRITMPHLGQFESGDEYYATLFHELVHSTSHPRRLNRLVEAEGNAIEKYSFEELVAELGAAFLCGFAGLKNTMTEQLQSSYIAGWAQVFRQDSHMLVKAASAAQRAADYIRGKKVPDAEPKES